MLLLLHLIEQTAAFQQQHSGSSFSFRQHQVSTFHYPITTCPLSAPDAAVLDKADYSTKEGEIQLEYDWDEQFQELLSFKEQYGHCNFPQNAPDNLTREFPTLAKFCHDQRLEYKQFKIKGLTSLRQFDRKVRFRLLKDNGFEFNMQRTLWYDKYHELVKYRRVNGDLKVKSSDNTLHGWLLDQRARRKGVNGYTSLSNAQVELLDDIGFEWVPNPLDDEWRAKYNELVDFRNKHGHLWVPVGTPIYLWMRRQKNRRAGRGRALSEDQIRLLDDIGFSWQNERNDKKWHAKYDELVRFKQTHGHCQPKQGRTNRQTESIYQWTIDQRRKRDEGRLSEKQIKLLDEIEFPWKGIYSEWKIMFAALLQYYKEHDNVQVDRDNDSTLYEWMTIQRQRYHGPVTNGLSNEQIEKLESLNFSWSLDWKERTWHETYAKIVEYYKQNGHVQVNKKDNPSLYNWIQVQGKRYRGMKGQKPLSQEELELLEQIDFSFFEDQPRTTWNAIFAELNRYRTEHDGNFPTHKDDPNLYRWMRQQRMRLRGAYGHVPLSNDQRSHLESIDFPILPNGREARGWYAHYDELVEFGNRHGNFLVDSKEYASLYKWVEKQRIRYKATSSMRQRPLIKPEIYLLERIGFPWTSDRYDVEWQIRYNELVQFRKEHGHLRMQKDGHLYKWVQRQRGRYNGTYNRTLRLRNSQLSAQQIQQLEEIDGFRWSGGPVVR
ncbi:unnamed protein product [Cylindrotheca closterium]|uniref:Helicase-associated domain-containing protein n=1 Tax=Cylindrotheca closterium TaxID=2856 RepID=A0AAD2JJC0_9STRA|nr:unnamed protein product [Cylindrotheca closterium]